MAKEKPLAVYAGETFANMMRAYGKDRMPRDPQYRRDVFREMERRAKQKQEAKHDEA